MLSYSSAPGFPAECMARFQAKIGRRERAGPFILLINIRGLAFARAYAGAKALHNFSEGNPFVLEFLSHDKLWYNEIAQNKSYIFL